MATMCQNKSVFNTHIGMGIVCRYTVCTILKVIGMNNKKKHVCQTRNT